MVNEYGPVTAAAAGGAGFTSHPGRRTSNVSALVAQSEYGKVVDDATATAAVNDAGTALGTANVHVTAAGGTGSTLHPGRRTSDVRALVIGSNYGTVVDVNDSRGLNDDNDNREDPEFSSNA